MELFGQFAVGYKRILHYAPRCVSLARLRKKDGKSSHHLAGAGRDLAHVGMFKGLDSGKLDDYGLITRCPIH